MATDDELLAEVGHALHGGDREPPADRVAGLRAAAAARQATPGPVAPTVAPTATKRRERRVALAVAGVAAAALALVAGGALLDRATDEDPLAGGVVEFEATLASPDSDATATVTGIATGIGRVVQVRSDDLAILPKGEFYEVWFVGPGDSNGSPNRISAGTFHPDANGRSAVDLTAAVDPALYPGLSVTAEPGDGDPLPTGVEVLHADIELDR